MMSPEIPPSAGSEPAENDKDERRKIIFALLFLLLSFSCIFCSSQSALWLINRDWVEASMRSNLTADYGFDPALLLAPLSEEIIAEAARDEAALLARQTPIAGGLGIVILPNPIPTPLPTVVVLLPTPLPTPTVAAPANPNPATATFAPPTATQAPPPTLPPATSTNAPPTTAPPTSPATAAPTLPATVPPTAIPTVIPTVPPTEVPTAIPTPVPTDVPTSAPTLPVVAFSAATFQVNESSTSATITVVLNRNSAQTVTVDYASTGGTAAAGLDYQPVSGTLTFLPGQTSQTFNVTIVDDTTANESAETVLLQLSNPGNASLGLSSATLTIADNDAVPTLSFSSASYAAGEASGVATITVTLNPASSLPVTVNYATSNGTAAAGSDYTAVSNTLTFAPGQTSRTFTVPLFNDSLAEADETVGLTLSAPTNASLGSPAAATLTILDDDDVFVQFSSSTYNTPEASGSTSIGVNLSTASTLTITVNYTTTGGSASPGADYQDTSGVLTFAPGVTSQAFSVTILNDNLDELDETVTLTLGNPTNATLGTPSGATLSIIDDDTATLQFSRTNYLTLENDSPAPITVTLSLASALTVTVDYASSDITATAGDDYDSASGQLTFPPGTTNQIFSVTITNDNLDEPNETIGLALSNPNGAVLGTPVNATLTISDDDVTAGCPGEYTANEPDIGSPDGGFARIACGVAMVIDMSASPINRSGDGNFDLVYYEVQGIGTPPPNPPEQIFMDWVIIEVGQTPTGPWFQVFNWGDAILDANTNIGQAGYGPPENDNTLIPMTTPPLYGTNPYTTGITIDVDAPLTVAGAPPGPYPYVRIVSPAGGSSDGPEVDALEALP